VPAAISAVPGLAYGKMVSYHAIIVDGWYGACISSCTQSARGPPMADVPVDVLRHGALRWPEHAFGNASTYIC
jgi:hypothetical protein